jgi:hypothetical protein
MQRGSDPAGCLAESARALILFVLIAAASPAQMQHPMNMSGMNMSDMNAASMSLMTDMSGTAQNPDAWPMPMITKAFGPWTAMFMGQAFLVDTQQSGPRGHDKFYSSNWFMANADRSLGKNSALELQLMLSLEPATITERRYPLLFQTGETAFGKAIEDGQHPHNFVMGLGVLYARALSENATLELYVAPVGDPALGPIAYPHRASAAELPQAPLAHHWEDSTHIINDVITAGLAYKKIKLEASGFHGAEPNENRWTIAYGAIDSWSARFWFFPNPRWAAQISLGRLTRPEALEPGDQTRSTASVEYSRPVTSGMWSTTLIWGRDYSTVTHRGLNAFTGESLFPLSRRNFLTGRVESVNKDELFRNEPAFPQAPFRVEAYTLGYTRDLATLRNVETGIGANVSTYTVPGAIKPYYGAHPVGGNIYLRLRLLPSYK